MKLGLNPSPPDFRTVHLEPYLSLRALPPAPSSCNWEKDVQVEWGMMLNDQIGDCAIAGPAHMELAWTSYDDDSAGPYRPADDDVLAAYCEVSGYRPGYPETDVGCDLLSVMKHWQRAGIGRSRITAYATVSPQAANGITVFQQACYLFGGVLLGLGMPARWQRLPKGHVWDAPNGQIRRQEDRPGGWGGHAVPAVSYGRSGIKVVTWGGVQTMTWRALQLYCFDARVALGPSWCGANRKTVHGFNADQLAADIAAIR